MPTLDRPTLFGSVSGRIIDYALPDISQITVHDIANALSKICRFSGQCEVFYSVAQHSVHVADRVAELDGTPEEQLQGLFHDAAEAFIGDIPRPLKRLVPSILHYENLLLSTIMAKLDLPNELSPKVVQADNDLLLTEKRLFQPNGCDWPCESGEELNTYIGPQSHHWAKQEFLNYYDILKRSVGCV